jgi:hypothetical protein
MSYSAGSEGSNPGTPNTAPGSPTSHRSQPSAPVLQAAHGSQTSQPVPTFDVQALAQSLASIITQAVASSTVSAPPVIPVTHSLPNSVAPAVHSLLPSRNFSIPKLNDLPKFKGFGIDGSDATSFLFTLEDVFDLHHVASAHRVILVGQTFPHSTPALAWYQSARAAATFEKNGILNWETFKDIFVQKFQTPQSRRLALLDSYDRFQQRGTLTDHRLRFDRLCMQLEHVGVTLADSFTASKYLRSLRPDLRNRVELKYSELPDTLETVHAAALDAEYAITNRSSKPPSAPPPIKLQAIDPLRANPRAATSRKFCVYHKSNNHNSSECSKIKELHKQGKWKGPWPLLRTYTSVL